MKQTPLKSAYSAIKGSLRYKRGKKTLWGRYTREALRLAKQFDCLPEQLEQQQHHPERVAKKISDRICNWYLPQFSNPYYGGVMTVLRLADHLQRCHGIKQRILICDNARTDEVSTNIVRAFSDLSKAEIISLGTEVRFDEIPPADYSIATLWSTAYILLGVENTGYKFYMIQDFEPAFYPAGSTYAQVELTYWFGFYGIANTQSLKEIYEQDYGGTAVLLRPSIDKRVFYPNTEKKFTAIKRLFYYARPGTPRNGFEVAVTALQQLKQEYGDLIDIVCAGADWNPVDYGLGRTIRNVGLLPYEGTGELYRNVHVGLVMMMTKHPSYLPLELMASGAIVVSNYNPATTWLLKNGENCLLSAPIVSCLVATLRYALDNYEQLAPLRKHAASQILADGADWETSLSKVASFILEPPNHPLQSKSIVSSLLSEDCLFRRSVSC